jgi:hypothetical protein
MSGRIKHMERSHRSYKNNHADFRRFASASLHKNAVKQKKTSIFGRIAKLFKHQDR